MGNPLSSWLSACAVSYLLTGAEQDCVWVEVGVDVGSGLQPLLCGGEIKEVSASLSASCSSSRSLGSLTELDPGPRNLRKLWAFALLTPSELGVHWQTIAQSASTPFHTQITDCSLLPVYPTKGMATGYRPASCLCIGCTPKLLHLQYCF